MCGQTRVKLGRRDRGPRSESLRAPVVTILTVKKNEMADRPGFSTRADQFSVPCVRQAPMLQAKSKVRLREHRWAAGSA